MTQIPDAPWIRDAEINGYPTGNDTCDIDIFEWPSIPSWLATGVTKGE